MSALKRQLGFMDAVLLGLGSIIGTGIYVSIAYAAGVGGPLLIPAIAAAALVASLNALSSAQLAAAHPVSGGTYEYGFRYLMPWLGFSAGWMFLCAKTASAATAALGVSSYLLGALGIDLSPGTLHWLAAGIALSATFVVATGLGASTRVNLVLVVCSLAGLLAVIWSAAPTALDSFAGNLSDFSGTLAQTSPLYATLQCVALMFVAFTGYARVATLGEEVHEPRTTIPRAIIATLWISAGLYLLVAIAAVGALGAGDFAALLDGTAAPLETAARLLGHPLLARVVAVGALAAMLGVLLNLTLGLSRVLLAMGRRGDMPAVLGAVTPDGRPPLMAVLLPGLAIAALAAFSDIKAAWSFSAFSVLVYYSITNLAALKLQGPDRLFPSAIPACGLIACLSLSVFLDWRVVFSALALLLVGLVWHWLRRRSPAHAA